jgi:hypothetical protein
MSYLSVNGAIMFRHFCYIAVVSLSLGLLGGFGGPASAQEAPASEDGITVLTRGPVHEAYAEPADSNPQPGLVVPKQPPAPIPEQPPDQKPAGDNVQWVPGYWAWDVDRNDFIWVSGIWRVPPPDRQWVAGQWLQVAGGWQWSPGYWAPAGQAEITTAEAPPASLDYGPVTPAPDDHSIYVPGCWVVRDTGFAWRPGFWQEARPGWVWTNASYCWTPRGYDFVDGYWDYPLEGRGTLFAPVSFDQPLWTNPGWCYRPGYVVGGAGLLDSLFVRPGYRHYFFGDFYDARYDRLGFRPWFDYGRRFADPLFNYYRWDHRHDAGWYSGLRDRYLGRRDGALARPPRTLLEQNRFFRDRVNVHDVDHLRMVTPLSQFHGNGLGFAGYRGRPAAGSRYPVAGRSGVIGGAVSRSAVSAPRRPMVGADRFRGTRFSGSVAGVRQQPLASSPRPHAVVNANGYRSPAVTNQFRANHVSGAAVAGARRQPAPSRPAVVNASRYRTPAGMSQLRGTRFSGAAVAGVRRQPQPPRSPSRPALVNPNRNRAPAVSNQLRGTRFSATSMAGVRRQPQPSPRLRAGVVNASRSRGPAVSHRPAASPHPAALRPMPVSHPTQPRSVSRPAAPSARSPGPSHPSRKR